MWSKGFSCIKACQWKIGRNFSPCMWDMNVAVGYTPTSKDGSARRKRGTQISTTICSCWCLPIRILERGSIYVYGCVLSLCSANIHTVPLTKKNCKWYLLGWNKLTWKREGMQNAVWTCLSVEHRWLRAKGALGCGAGCSRRHVVHFGGNFMLQFDSITALSRVKVALPHQYLWRPQTFVFNPKHS